MRNNPSRISVKPRINRMDVVSPCCWYKMHEPGATSIVDALGNGPAFAISGSGTLDSVGRLAPAASNTTVRGTAAANDLLFSMLSLVPPIGQLIIALDYQSGNASIGQVATFFSTGVANSGATAHGSLAVGCNTTEQPTLGIRSGGVNTLITEVGTTSIANTVRNALVWDIKGGADGVSLDVAIHRVGMVGNTITSSFNIRTDNGSGLPPYGAGSNLGHTIGANQSSVGGYNQHISGSAIDTHTMQNLLIMRRPTYESGLALLIGEAMAQYPNEFPACLTGK